MKSVWRLGWLNVGDPTTRDGADLLIQRYQSLGRQVPLLYLTLLASFVGLHLATTGALLHLVSPVSVAVLVIVYRLQRWMRLSSRTLSAREAQKELRVTFCFAAALSVFFCAWALYLFERPFGEKQLALLFGSLASMGCAYGLSSFPKAARLPLFLLGLPLAVRSILTGEAAYVGTGMTLVLIILLVSRVLAVHNEDLKQLSESRSQTMAALLSDFKAPRQNLSKLKSKGVRVLLDDFGSGYASLSYLQEMEFDCIKLDGSLLQLATTSEKSRLLLKGVIDLCSTLSLPCVAEQVETREQLDLLAQLNCARVQGYLLSKPLSPAAARTLAEGDQATPRLLRGCKPGRKLRVVG